MVKFNDTNDSSDSARLEFHNFYYRIFATLIFGLLSMVGVVGNLLVITVVLKVKDMVTPTNCYLMSLAASDSLFFLAACPMQMSSLHLPKAGVFIYGPVGCSLLIYLPYLAINASSLSITAFTVERYIGICHPLRARYMCTVKRARSIIAFIWVFSIIYNSPWLYLADLKPINVVGYPDAMACTFKIRRDSWSYKMIFMGDFTVFYAVPMLLYVALYSRVIIALTAGPLLRTEQRSFRTSVESNAAPPEPTLPSERNMRLQQLSSGEPIRRHSEYISRSTNVLEVRESVCDTPRHGNTTDTITRKSLPKDEIESSSTDDCIKTVTNNSALLLNSVDRVKDKKRYGTVRASKQPSVYRSNGATKGRGQVVKMLAMVVLAFAVCWFPYRTIVMYNSFASETWTPTWYMFLAKTMIFVNCAINPILYNLMSRKFRSSFALLIQSICRYKQSDTAYYYSDRPKVSIVSSVSKDEFPLKPTNKQ